MNTRLTAVSLLTAAALAAAAFGGCTTSSSTLDDTDGGTQPREDASTGDPDTGTGTVACTSNTKQNSDFIDKTCQACLDTKCCTELTTCFNIAGVTDGGTPFECNAYVDQVEQCNQQPSDQIQGCIDDLDSLSATGVPAAYDAIVTCGETNCATECQFETADGG